MMTVTTGGECPMIDTPTRRVVLGAGVFSAGSLLMVDGSVAQTPLAPTPACHDGDDVTAPQTEGPYFKPSSPERTELFEEGMAGQPIELVGFVLTRACKPLAGALLDFWLAVGAFRLRGRIARAASAQAQAVFRRDYCCGLQILRGGALLSARAFFRRHSRSGWKS